MLFTREIRKRHWKIEWLVWERRKFNAVSAYWFRSHTNRRNEGLIFLALLQLLKKVECPFVHYMLLSSFFLRFSWDLRLLPSLDEWQLTPVKVYTSERYSNLLSFILLHVDGHILFLLSASFVFPKKDGLANYALYFAWKMLKALTKKGTFRNPLFLHTLLLSLLFSFALFYFWDDYQETENSFENFCSHKKTYRHINRIIIEDLTTVCNLTGLRLRGFLV